MIRNEKPKSKISWKTKAVFLALLIGLVFIIMNFSRGFQKNRQINREIGGLKAEIGQLEKDNLELKQMVDYFNSTAYIEEKARVDLGLKKEGEKVVVIADSAKNKLAQNKTEAAAEKPKTNPQKWWQYFFE
ncbi:MAG: hypothetical protein A3J65_00845 [Candidatus Buchananbacteria bacterium RIFCSPHIGHO2_02_FULL_45_11b]|uniref:Cell division protein FtsL n=4 Tax=Candidatus Buchananiibacteriota TaxID=1817903 RepID=A0A1G1YJ02_9BACT|nr:MAG: hypothetical protein A2663_03975 [Candidatus Buchananbacteria bacterium RIFCSPHIGHO2_01_FULL_46_12]OGY52325.1 MAG: hypothetical protein A3J65_00845 [Candidatus Buchananbacteria bacterium RIFCSPHIGHO2_02_FULL_45_11b]OGY53192.1 MAG: hypothetical protein A3B15_02825 [Candidatus Buchananbacteria bacterium RIFCSPLOWO2_01_FULL_45_31]OGY56718.1 MAG: hypothetical protein A3H67_04865 [Candidatus Buchananbacteria bacterium RIFCSPLOWO2_02_FULL_46_11b]HLC89824.1 septum formation initiator family pr